MDISYDLIASFFSNYWVIISAVLFLLIYQLLSPLIKKLPKIPIGLLLLYLFLRIVLMNFPESLNPKGYRLIDALAAVTIYCAVVRLVFSIFVESWLSWKRGTAVPKITRDLVLIASYTAIVFVVLRTRGGVNLAGLITTSAVLTAVIGLAAQNVLGNLFAGISIQMSHPFRTGDWIQYGDSTGKVISIGWESTRLKTFDDEMIIIPNLDISKSVIKNHSLPTPMHAMKIEVGVEYGTSPNSVREVLLGVCREEPLILQTPEPVVRVINYGESSIVVQMRFFYNGFEISPDLKASVMNRIWYALRRHNIRIPYPIRDIQIRHVERRLEAEKTARLRKEALLEVEKVPILKTLSPEDINTIANHMAVEEYASGEIIVKQGDVGNSLYIIHRGACDVEVAAGLAPPSKVATLAPPAFFGEMSLLTGEPRSATVRARGDTQVFSIDKSLFKEILVAHPGVSEELAKALVKRQGETSKFVDKRMTEQDSQTQGLIKKIKIFFGLV